MNTLHLAAPGISEGQIFGAVTLSGLSAAAAIGLVLGVRGSDRIKINTKDKAAWWGIVTGTLWEAAGGAWSDIAEGIGSVPKGVLGEGSGFGNPGLGGIALVLTLLAFGPRWKRLIWPALLGISAAVVYAEAGGIWGILVNVVHLVAAKITGGIG
ncbi:hypothetical protein [Streptomyces sp. NPDC006307]|uniref:hypothetical protein n=1 Tax=Streptomyces sp. NPDC006307 TaxID=3156748 RepID=UPI0033A086BB